MNKRPIENAELVNIIDIYPWIWDAGCEKAGAALVVGDASFENLAVLPLLVSLGLACGQGLLEHQPLVAIPARQDPTLAYRRVRRG